MARSKKNRNSEKVYEFLLKNASDPVPPTVREICKATGITSTSTVHAALAALEREGHIKRDARSSRSIRLVGTENTAMVPVLELRRRKASLEDVFLELTEQTAAPEDGGAERTPETEEDEA